MIEAVSAVSAGFSAPNELSLLPPAQQNPTLDFASMLSNQIEHVNTDLSTAETSLQQLASGQPVELHDVMINLEQARIGVQTLIQVRNRVVEAYQDVIRMQI